MPVTVTHDLSKIWIALRTAMLADADLVSLLYDGTAIYLEEPTVQIPLPAIIFRPQNENAQPGDTHAGLWRPELKLDILTGADATAPTAGRRIAGYLTQAWCIPQTRATAVQSTYLQLDVFRPLNGVMPIGRVQLQESGQGAYLTASLWQARVIHRASP